jgi:hypothetical protein
LDAAGQYQSVAPDATDVYRSRVLPGFWLRVAWLWQDPLPDPSRVLFTIDRGGYAAYLRRAAESPEV